MVYLKRKDALALANRLNTEGFASSTRSDYVEMLDSLTRGTKA